jgi:RNA polymerase sigma-70 factor (ECF subfamily)
MPFDDLSDAVIVENYLRTQDQSYFEEMYSRYANKIFYKCYSILKDSILAEDAVQDIFMKVLLNLANYSGRSSFSTWIYSITYNYCIDQVRRFKKVNAVISDQQEINEIGYEDEDYLIKEDNLEALRNTLDVIDEADKMILLMKYQDNLRLKEIAEVLSISESAVKMRLQRAKEKFRKIYTSVLQI